MNTREKIAGIIGGMGPEATVDLMRLAGLDPCGVLCELTNPDGSMARGPEIVAFAEASGLPVLAVADLVRHRQSSGQ